jgi:hypothetical protein
MKISFPVNVLLAGIVSLSLVHILNVYIYSKEKPKARETALIGVWPGSSGAMT